MFNKILVPLDGSKLAECVFSYVEDIAKMRSSIVELITVYEPFEMPPHGGMVFDEEDEKEYNEYGKKKTETYIRKIKDFFQSKGIETKATLLVGKAAECLVDYAQGQGIDLIIMATHGRSGVERWIMGSIADRLVHYSTIPVLLIRAMHRK
jgi:nucleotide-binding universal stress UspA family protein